MQAIEIEKVKKGEFLKRKPDAKKTYTRGDYARTHSRYRIDDWDDISRDMLLSKGTLVWVGFTF